MRMKSKQNNLTVAALLRVITSNGPPDTRRQVGDRGFHLPLSPWQKSLDPRFALPLSPWQQALDPHFRRAARDDRHRSRVVQRLARYVWRGLLPRRKK